MYSGSGRGVSSLRASSPGRSGGGAGKGRRPCNYVSGIWISASKRRRKMLIGGYDISNDIITLGTFFSMFVYIRARSCFALIGGNLTAQSAGSHRGIGGGVQICKPSFLFPSRRQRAPESWSRIPAPFSRHPTSRTSVISIPCQDLSESRFPGSRSHLRLESRIQVPLTKSGIQ